MKKLSMLLVAVLALAMMMGFVGCKQEDDVPSGPSAVATWENSSNPNMTFELTAYSDSTWKLVARAGAQSVEYAKGTYTGDATKDGSLTVKVTHEFDDSSQSLKELATPSEHTATISGKTLKVPAVLFGGSGTIDFTRK